MRFWVGFSDKMTTSEIRKNVNKPKVGMPYSHWWVLRESPPPTVRYWSGVISRVKRKNSLNEYYGEIKILGRRRFTTS